MLSQTAEYALRAVVCLAGHGEAPLSTTAVASLTGVPRDYMSKVLQALARAGLVRSTGGRSGGFLLSRSPQELTILDVVEAVDPIRRIEHCPLNPQIQHTDLCPLHRELDTAIARTRDAFARCRVADLLSDTVHAQALCQALVGPEKKPRGRRKRARE